MTNRTPEPWHIVEYTGHDQAAIRSGESDIYKPFAFKSLSVENAERIVACVNYLEGVPNELLNGSLRTALSELYEELFRAYVDPYSSAADALQAVKEGLGEALELIGVDVDQIETRVTNDDHEICDGCGHYNRNCTCPSADEMADEYDDGRDFDEPYMREDDPNYFE